MKITNLDRLSRTLNIEEFNEEMSALFYQAFYAEPNPNALKQFELKSKKNLISTLSDSFNKKKFIAHVERFVDVGLNLESFHLLTAYAGFQLYKNLKKNSVTTPHHLLFNIVNPGNNSLRFIKKNDFFLDGKIKFCILPNLESEVIIPIVLKNEVHLFCTTLNGSGVYATKTISVDLSVNFYELTFKKFTLTKKNYLGKIKFTEYSDILYKNIIMLSAIEVGLATQALNLANEYAKTRSVQGFPISKHQSISHRLVDMLLEIEKMKSLLLYISENFQTLDGAEKRALTSMLKYTSSSNTLVIVQNAIQIFGAKGFQWTHPLNFFLRRALLIRSLGGSVDAHLKTAAEKILTTTFKTKEIIPPQIEISIFNNTSNGAANGQREIFH